MDLTEVIETMLAASTALRNMVLRGWTDEQAGGSRVKSPFSRVFRVSGKLSSAKIGRSFCRVACGFRASGGSGLSASVRLWKQMFAT